MREWRRSVVRETVSLLGITRLPQRTPCLRGALGIPRHDVRGERQEGLPSHPPKRTSSADRRSRSDHSSNTKYNNGHSRIRSTAEGVWSEERREQENREQVKFLLSTQIQNSPLENREQEHKIGNNRSRNRNR